MPPRVDYDLTPLGRTLFEPLASLARWAGDHFDEVEHARRTYDARTTGVTLDEARPAGPGGVSEGSARGKR